MLTLATISPGEPEIFASFQGEGASAGAPCVFIRLSRCNLACRWCDTAYTWNFKAHDRAANQLKLSEAEAARRVIAADANHTSRLVITGGEPLLQAPALARLLGHLPNWHIEIETNGTAAPPPALAERIDQWNVSPKLAHSGNARALAIKPNALAAFVRDRRATFKFVIAAPDDVAEVLELAKTHAIPAARIFLMPEGRDSATLKARLEWLGPLAIAHGFSISDRLHIHAFGDTRGT